MRFEPRVAVQYTVHKSTNLSAFGKSFDFYSNRNVSYFAVIFRGKLE